MFLYNEPHHVMKARHRFEDRFFVVTVGIALVVGLGVFLS